MKKRILYTVLLAAGLAFSSCSDQFLQDMNPYDSYSPEKTFGIESNLDLYIQNVYYNYFYKSMGHRTKRFFQWSGKMGERF